MPSSSSSSSSTAKPPDRPLRGLAILLGLLITAFGTYTFVMAPALLLQLVPTDGARRLLRTWEGWVAGQWLAFGGWLLEAIGGVRIVITGDRLPPHERALVISNHRTRVDWMWMWCAFCRFGLIASYRVVLKADMRAYPWWGWGMSACAFLFIKRGSQNRARDLGRIQALCHYLRRLSVPNSLILFPEGTDLSESNQRRDAEYAAKQGLKPYTYVLHPRGGAFAASMAVLRPNGAGPAGPVPGGDGRRGLDALYDLTMAYDDYAPGERPNELGLLRGRLPRAVHIHVQRIPAAALPQDDAQCERFLAQSFERKEAALRDYYTKGVPLGEGKGQQQQGEQREQGARTPRSDSRDYARAARAAYTQGLVCMALIAAAVVALGRWLSPLAFWGYVGGVTAVTLVVIHGLEGWDSLELRLVGEEGWGGGAAGGDGEKGKAT